MLFLILPVASNYTEVNVEKEFKDPDSTLNYYRKLATFRKESEDIKYGSINFLDSPEDVLMFAKGEKTLVVINFSANDFKTNIGSGYQIAITHKKEDVSLEGSTITVKAKRSVILKKN